VLGLGGAPDLEHFFVESERILIGPALVMTLCQIIEGEGAAGEVGRVARPDTLKDADALGIPFEVEGDVAQPDHDQDLQPFDGGLLEGLAKLRLGLGKAFLQVQDLTSKAIKLLAIDKMNSITVGQKETDPRETQKLLKFIDSAWGIMVTGEIQKVVFKVDEDIYPYFERHKIHWTQQNEKVESALKVSIAIHNLEEFKRWIYRFGYHISGI